MPADPNMIRVLVDKLITVATEEFRLVPGLKNELSRLRASLVEIREFLEDAERQAIELHEVTRWLHALSDAAYDADDVVDEISYENMRRMVEGPNQTKSKTWFCFNAKTDKEFERKMAPKINRIMAGQLKLLAREASPLGLERRVSKFALSLHPGPVMETGGIASDFVVGKENDVSKLVNMLINPPTDEAISFIPIVGMGGNGKTNLARLIFNHPSIKVYFNERIWVVVSENFDPTNVFKSMLKSLKETFPEDGGLQAVIGKLRDTLAGKRSLLVLDDLWDARHWHDFKNLLVGIIPSKGNAILVTTRFRNVAHIVNRFVDPYFSQPLTNDECWSLLKEMACGNKQVPHQCEEVLKNIAYRCHGVPPLAVKLIGRTLEGMGEGEWLSILQKIPSSEDYESILQVMKVCYDLLPSASLKKCFSYCSVFAQDSILNREELVQLWMAQGFLPDFQGRDIESTGNLHFDILLHRCFFQEALVDKLGNVVSCKMHDLVHDLARSLSESETFKFYGFNLGREMPQSTRYLSVESLQVRVRITNETASNVRSLFSKASITDNMSSYFNRLRSLILREAYIKELPISVDNLIHLRCLDASYNPIERLADSVCKLYHLETLRIFTLNLQELPEKLHNLIRLRHLYFNGPQIQMPPHIGRLTRLRTLSSFNVSDKEGCRIDELGYLKNLGGKLTIHKLELVKDKEEAIKADLIGKKKIYKLKFIWSKSREANNNDQNVLEGLQPHKNLKSIKIEGFRGQNFPSWAMKMEIDGLIQIKMSHCDSCENIPMLGHLPRLKYLEFDGLTSVTSIDTSFYGDEDGSSTSRSQEGRVYFPSLERLVLKKMINLVDWKEPMTGVQIFPRLEYLEVSECPKLMDFPISFSSLHNLIEITLRSCNSCKKVPTLGHVPALKYLEFDGLTSVTSIDTSFYYGDNSGITSNSQERIAFFPSLERLILKRMSNLVDWEPPTLMPGEETTTFPRLEFLELNACPQLMYAPNHFPCLSDLSLRSVKNDSLLEEICTDDRTTLTKLQILFANEITCLPDTLFRNNQNLRELRIYHCPKLRELPEGLHSLNALQTLEIGDCPSLQSIPYSGEQKGLRHLNISYCQGLSGLPSKMLTSCTDLSLLSIFKCPELTSLPFRIGRFSGLTELSIGQFSESMDFSSFEATLEGIKNLNYLRRLTLYGRADWESVPISPPWINTSITELGLHDFGIQALPEWLLNLSSLQQLKLWRCEKLEKMPSKAGMLLLEGLKRLYIDKCPLLRKQYTGAANRDQLSHIPDVKIDGRPIVFWLNRQIISSCKLPYKMYSNLRCYSNFYRIYISIDLFIFIFRINFEFMMDGKAGSLKEQPKLDEEGGLCP